MYLLQFGKNAYKSLAKTLSPLYMPTCLGS